MSENGAEKRLSNIFAAPKNMVKKDDKSIASDFVLEEIITWAVQVPGVKVDRSRFLAENFSSNVEKLESIIDNGPIAAGISREEINAIADKLILARTSQSSLASFVAGIPGGLAMAATIPADILQFFGMALRLAQELSYLYGAEDLWENGQVDNEISGNHNGLLYIFNCGYGILPVRSPRRLHDTASVVHPAIGDNLFYGLLCGKGLLGERSQRNGGRKESHFVVAFQDNMVCPVRFALLFFHLCFVLGICNVSGCKAVFGSYR